MATLTDRPDDKIYQEALKNTRPLTPAPLTQQHNSPATVQQPTAPTSVASVNNAMKQNSGLNNSALFSKSQTSMGRPYFSGAYRNNTNENENGLRAVLAPYQSRGGFRNLSQNERNQMQMQYRDLANMKGLSNRQRQAYLTEMKNQMAQYGMKPTFDLSSNKGLSQRQIAENMLQNGAINRSVLDNQQKIAGANNWHNYNRAKFLGDYEDMLWG